MPCVMFFVWFLHSTFAMITRLVIRLGAFAVINCFPSGGLSCFGNRCACREHTETIHHVLENLFLDFGHLLQESTCPNLQHGASWSCVSATRLVLYCVCDLQKNHELQDCLVLSQCSWRTKRKITTSYLHLLEQLCHPFVLVRIPKKLFHQ